MGNIRTSFVKRLAKELIETHKGVFTTDLKQKISTRILNCKY